MTEPCWRPCPFCKGVWCDEHGLHVQDCPCPPIEKWGDVNPYLPEEEVEKE